jgi:hypothetical protein
VFHWYFASHAVHSMENMAADPCEASKLTFTCDEQAEHLQLT